MKKQDDKNTDETNETSKKKLRIKTSAAQPLAGPEFPCTTLVW